MLMRTLLGLLNVRGLVSGQRIARAIVSIPIFLALMQVPCPRSRGFRVDRFSRRGWV